MKKVDQNTNEQDQNACQYKDLAGATIHKSIKKFGPVIKYRVPEMGASF